MTILTRKHEELLDRLIAFAGNPIVVQVALRELNAELTAPPSLEQVLQRILVVKERDRDAVGELAAR